MPEFVCAPMAATEEVIVVRLLVGRGGSQVYPWLPRSLLGSCWASLALVGRCQASVSLCSCGVLSVSSPYSLLLLSTLWNADAVLCSERRSSLSGSRGWLWWLLRWRCSSRSSSVMVLEVVVGWGHAVRITADVPAWFWVAWRCGLDEFLVLHSSRSMHGGIL
jgi:hypothetical protein